MKRFPYLGLLVLLLTSPCQAAEPQFRTDVAPILASRCISCHGSLKARGGYRLDTFANLLKPGKSEAAPIVAGKPDESDLLDRVTTTDEKRRMPPGDDPLSPGETEQIRAWIKAGGRFDGDAQANLKSILPPRTHPAAPQKYAMAAPIFALAFSPDGKELAVGGVNEVTVWNPIDGKLLRRLERQPSRIHALVYAPDGKQLLVGGGTAGEYGEVALVDPVSGASRVLGTFDDVVLAAVFGADGQTVVAGGADHTARCYQVADGKERWRSSLHSDWITGIGVSPNGKWVATSSKDRSVKVLEAETGKLFTTFNGHRRQYSPHEGQFEVYAVTFDAAGTVYSVGAGTAIRVWDVIKTRDESGSAADMEERFKNVGHARYYDYRATKPAFAMTLGGDSVFSAGGDRVVRQHDAATGKLVRELAGHTDWIQALAVHPASNHLASGSFDGEVRVWDLKTGMAVTAFKAAPGLQP